MRRMPSVRTYVFIAIIVMGAVGIALAMVTGELYSKFALDTERSVIRSLVEIQTKLIVDDLRAETHDLSYSLQSEESFITPIKTQDLNTLDRMLGVQFQRQYAEDGLIHLTGIAVFDRDYGLTSHASNIISNSTELILSACPDVVRIAARRPATEHLKSMARFCNYEGRPYFSLLTPIGGIRPYGFLILETDPITALATLEYQLGMPIYIESIVGEGLYQSMQWPEHLHNDILISERYTYSQDGQPMFRIYAANDISVLNNQIANTRNWILMLAGLIIGSAMFGASWVLQATVINPLHHLAFRLRQVREDKSALGKQVEIGGNAEVNELAAEFNDMTLELKGLYNSLEMLAMTDPLTSLPNRLELKRQLDELINYYQSRKTPFAMMLIDLDRFKQINDTLGHVTGDKLLQEVSKRLHHNVRGTDRITQIKTSDDGGDNQNLLARLGGDEFAILLPDVLSENVARKVAENLLHVMEEPIALDEHSVKVNMSIGIALYPAHGENASDLLSHADVAMYEAKRVGGGFAFYQASLESILYEQLLVENDLRRAINENELQIFYQPQVDVKTGKVVGVEALIRWIHPERGFIPPDFFIPIAEQTTLIDQLTMWVFDRAISDCARLRALNHRLQVSVNVASRNLYNDDVITAVGEILDLHRVPGETITLELTEGSIIADTSSLNANLARLDAYGVKLSIDDFGTAYSALSRLKMLPVDEIKIDKSFVIDMVKNDNDKAIVSAIIHVGQSLGLNVVAEGVEDVPHHELLGQLGGQIAQGFGIAKPMPFDELINWLDNPVWSMYLKVDAVSNVC